MYHAEKIIDVTPHTHVIAFDDITSALNLPNGIYMLYIRISAYQSAPSSDLLMWYNDTIISTVSQVNGGYGLVVTATLPYIPDNVYSVGVQTGLAGKYYVAIAAVSL